MTNETEVIKDDEANANEMGSQLCLRACCEMSQPFGIKNELRAETQFSWFIIQFEPFAPSSHSEKVFLPSSLPQPDNFHFLYLWFL